MPACKHSDTCDRDALEGAETCILHSEDPEKDVEVFEKAFEEHRENGGTDFRRIVFPKNADFQETTFEERAHFSGATFRKGANFQGATFKKGVDFTGAAFEEWADFSDAGFKKEAAFEETAFKEGTDFSGAAFGGWVDFSGADFRGWVGFRAIFEGAADFAGSTFLEADFFGATFEAEVDFSGTKFEERTDFEGAAFRTRADFKGATFEEWVDFEEAVFKKVTFTQATFGGKASFNRTFETDEETQFEEAQFDECKFERKTLFEGRIEGEDVFAGGKVSFANVTLSSDASLHFRYVDLSHCRFLCTDLRDVEFTGVKWCEEVSDSEWFNRIGIYDEVYEEPGPGTDESDRDDVLEGEGLPWSEIERLYRQLKQHYEARGDFRRAGDFHIGENEARRQGETRWGPWLLLTGYRALSKYGERALPTALWLLGVVPGFALLYFLLEASTPTTTGSIAYPRALLFSLEATFFPVKSVEFVKFWPRLLSLVQRVISPILIVLLALALRQRVRW